MRSASRRWRVVSLPALGGAIGAVAVDALYLGAIVQQGVTPPGSRVPLVAIWIAVAALLAGIGAFTQATASRATLLAMAAAAMLTLAVPAAFSIGVPLLICALAVGLGASRAAEELRLPRWVILVAPILLIIAVAAILYVGFTLTQG